MPRALVLGGETGLLGQEIVGRLHKKEWSVATLGRKDGNIQDADFVLQKINEVKPDVVFNTIAWTQVDDAEDHPEGAKSINADFPAMLARILSRTKSHLIHYSTDFVFDGDFRSPISEETSPSPKSVYGRTKALGEECITTFLPTQSAIIRTAWLFGPARKNFVATIVNAAKGRSELRVVADQTGSPTYTPDLAEWSVALAEERATGIWHGVNAGAATWHEVASKALEFAQIECSVIAITSAEWPQKAKRPTYSVLDGSKLDRFLAAKNLVRRHWEESLKSYVGKLVNA